MNQKTTITTVGNSFLSIISIIFPGEQRTFPVVALALSFVVGILLIITGFFLWQKRRPSTNKNSSSDKYTSNAIGQDDSSREHRVLEPYMELSPWPFEEQSCAAPECQSLQGSTGTSEYYNISEHYSTPESYNIPWFYSFPGHNNVGLVRETTAQTGEEEYEIGNSQA